MRISGASIVTGPQRQALRALCRGETPPRPTPETDSGRVVVDVGDDLVEVALVGDHAGLEPALEEVAAAVVAAVEAHRVQAVQAPHAVRELWLRRLDEQMEMVVEQDPDVNLPAEPRLDVEELLEPGLAIEVVEDDRPLLDSATDHVVPRGARELRARNARHPVEASARRRDETAPNDRPVPGTCPRDSPWDMSVAAVPLLVTACKPFPADCG